MSLIEMVDEAQQTLFGLQEDYKLQEDSLLEIVFIVELDLDN